MPIEWDRFSPKYLKLSEGEKVRLAILLKQDPEQARRHPKYFGARVVAILDFIEGYQDVLPNEILKIAEEVRRIVSL